MVRKGFLARKGLFLFRDLKRSIQRIIKDCYENDGLDWTDEVEKNLFTSVRTKTSGDHDGYPRRLVALPMEETNFSPSHIVRVGTVIHFGRLPSGVYVRFLGE